MKMLCDCYHTQKELRYTYDRTNGNPIPHNIEVGVCYGTKEIDKCNCQGDRTQCDFYPEIRKKEIDKITTQEAINHFKYGISHDIFNEPVKTYAKLAVEALEKQL